MYTVIGLGNPGEEYSATRHNLGYRVVEALSRLLRAGEIFHLRWSICAAAEYKKTKVILAQPLTYMNNSGKAAAELVRRYSLDGVELVVIHDDLDLPPGTIRLRLGGGSAGHRGVQSIIDTLGSADFIRLRIGIGKPPSGMDGADYVLEKVAPGEQPLIDAAVEQAVQAVALLLHSGLEAAMNRYNRVLRPEASCDTISSTDLPKGDAEGK